MEELIEAVRSEKCLYDVKHQDYMNTKLKDSIWKRIAEALNLKDGSEAKKSWEKLRNNHRDALRRQKMSKPKSGSGVVNIKAWRYQENMAFLIPHMANRPSNTNVNEDILNDESSHSNSNTIENDIQKNVSDTDIHESGVEETNETPESQSTRTAADQGNKRRRKKNTLNNLLTKSIEDHERRAAKRQQERERLIANTNNDFTISNVKNDPLFHFFISMYETTKRLPPLSQHNIKTNIFSLVSQEESKNLMEYSPRPHSSYSQNSDVRSYYSSYTPSPAEQQPHSDAGTYYTSAPIQQQQQEGSEAKKSWEKLRNNHRDALRRQKMSKPKSGSGVVNIKAWRYQENMAFLIPHMANRPSNTNVNEDILNDESSHSNSNTIENDIQKNVSDTDIHESGVEETNETPESQSTRTAADQGNKRRRKKNTLNNLLTKSIEDHERRAAKRQQERERLIANTNNDFTISNVKNDPLFHFFISMYETTKRLPPLSQHNIKTNIFSLVSQEESKNLMEYSPRPHSSYSQNSDVRSYSSSYTPSPAEQQPHSDAGTYYTSAPIQQQQQEGGTPNIIITQGNELDTSENVFQTF